MKFDTEALRAKLIKGAGCADGTKLTREECEFLLRRLPRRRGPKPDPELQLRDMAIAELVELYEAEGDPTEVAVAMVMQCYGVARSLVYAARARWLVIDPESDPIWRRQLIWYREDHAVLARKKPRKRKAEAGGADRES